MIVPSGLMAVLVSSKVIVLLSVIHSTMIPGRKSRLSLQVKRKRAKGKKVAKERRPMRLQKVKKLHQGACRARRKQRKLPWTKMDIWLSRCLGLSMWTTVLALPKTAVRKSTRRRCAILISIRKTWVSTAISRYPISGPSASIQATTSMRKRLCRQLSILRATSTASACQPAFHLSAVGNTTTLPFAPTPASFRTWSGSSVARRRVIFSGIKIYLYLFRVGKHCFAMWKTVLSSGKSIVNCIGQHTTLWS